MRSGIVPGIVAVLVACSGPPQEGPVAQFAGHALATERLADLLVLAQPLPLDTATAIELAHHWLEVMAIAARSAAGDSLLDPEAVAAAMAPELRELRIGKLIERDAGDALGEALAIADSLYAEGDVRLLAHVFRRVGPDARPGEREVQRSTAEQIRQRLASGGDWADAVARSEDPDTRDRAGLIGLVRRGDLVTEFEGAAFALRPGELSAVVETEYGFHVIRRPRLEEVRATFARLLAEEMAASAESEIGARLLTGAHLAVEPDAADRTRTLARDPWPALGRDGLLIRHDGGTLREGDAARALLLLPPSVRAEMRRASEVEVDGFLRGLVLRNLLAARADSLGVAADEAATRAVTQRYRDALSAVLAAANISVDSLAMTPAGAERDRLAAERIDRYIEAVAARRVLLASVPPLLAARLLESVEWNVDAGAVTAAIESARRMLAAAESRGS